MQVLSWATRPSFHPAVSVSETGPMFGTVTERVAVFPETCKALGSVVTSPVVPVR
jgi:hypothetical protein